MAGDPAPGLGRLTHRAEFVALARSGRKAVMPGLILQARAHDARTGSTAKQRIGLTASRKVGGAVTRNRARRRLRALAAEVLPSRAAVGHDYVLIARSATATRPWAVLRDDLVRALRRLKLEQGSGQGETAGP